MYRPIKPLKYKYEYKEIIFPFGGKYSSISSIDNFNKWCKENIPAYSKDKTMSFQEHYTGISDIFEYKLTISFFARVENLSYKKEAAKYQKLITKYKKLPPYQRWGN